jgi:nucleotide-binding universal stress UspA family protein
MTVVKTEGRVQSGAAPLRVLVAVHGYEAAGWALETCRVVSSWEASVRVLAVLDVPSPPFTSLTGRARGAYDAARAEWADRERERLRPAVDALLAALTRDADVTHAPAVRGDLARTIADAAGAWPADVVVVGRPAGGPGAWLGPGPVHERLLRLAACTVLVTTPPSVTRGTRRLAAIPRRVAVPSAVVGQEA